MVERIHLRNSNHIRNGIAIKHQLIVQASLKTVDACVLQLRKIGAGNNRYVFKPLVVFLGLNVCLDEELAMFRLKSRTSGWVDIADVRRYQQETYTSILRTRRGPRVSRFSSQLSGRRT
jgi:hypothetical protein